MSDCDITNIIMPMSIQMVGPIKSHDMNNIMPMSMILSFSLSFWIGSNKFTMLHIIVICHFDIFFFFLGVRMAISLTKQKQEYKSQSRYAHIECQQNLS